MVEILAPVGCSTVYYPISVGGRNFFSCRFGKAVSICLAICLVELLFYWAVLSANISCSFIPVNTARVGAGGGRLLWWPEWVWWWW